MTNHSDTGNTRGEVGYKEETLDFEEDIEVSMDSVDDEVDIDGDDNDNESAIDYSNNNNNNNKAGKDINGNVSNDQDDDDQEQDNSQDSQDVDDDDDEDSGTEDEDDDEEEDEDNSQIDDSEPTCYICLNGFDGQDIGSPESCENIHEFCLECIEEWSKRINTCPIDRKEFNFILVRKQPGGEVVSRIPAIPVPTVEEELPFPDVTYCEVCNQCDREDRLLLCDGCDHGYHCECLSPALETIPIDEWFCPVCCPVVQPDLAPESDEENLQIDDEDEQNISRRVTRTSGLSHTSSHRRIARTGMFEFIRNRIASLRTSTETPTKRSTSKPRSRSTSKSRKRKSTKKRKSKRTTRSRKASRKLPPNRKHIASTLNITKMPKSHHGLPQMASCSGGSSADRNGSSSLPGITVGRSVSLFGSEKDFFELRSYDDSYQAGGDDASAGGIVTSTPAFINMGRVKKAVIPQSTRTFSVVDQLISSSNLLFEKADKIHIGTDGKIHLNETSVSVRKSVNGHENGSPMKTSASTSGNSANSTGNSTGSFKPVNTSYEHLPQTAGNSNGNSGSDQSSTGLGSFKNNDKQDKEDDEDIDGVAMDEEEVKKLEEESPSKKAAQKAQPSVKDLFGGDDSDEEIDDDLRKRIIEKGSIDPHFPLKLPIIFKTNFQDQKKKLDEEQEVSITKKWISIAPEVIERPKAEGPKWKSIEEPLPASQASTSGAQQPSTSSSSSSIVSPPTIIKPQRRKFSDTADESLNIPPKEPRPRVTFLSPEKETLPVKDDKPKVRVCKHGKIRREKKAAEKKAAEKTTPEVEDELGDIPEEMIDDMLEGIDTDKIVASELPEATTSQPEVITIDDDEPAVIRSQSPPPHPQRGSRRDDYYPTDGSNKEGRRTRRRSDNDNDERDKDRERRRRREQEDEERRRLSGGRDRRRGSRERSRERSPPLDARRRRSRSRDRAERARRGDGRSRREESPPRSHRTKEPEKGRSNGRKRSRTRSRTPVDDSRHRRHPKESSSRSSKRQRSRDRSPRSPVMDSRHRHRDEHHHQRDDRRDHRGHRDMLPIPKVDRKFEPKAKTPEDLRDSPPPRHSPPIKNLDPSMLKNFLPKNLDQVKKPEVIRDDSPFRGPALPATTTTTTQKIVMQFTSSSKLELSRTPVRDESPSSSGPSKAKDDMFYDADYPQELRDGLKIDEGDDEVDDAPYSPGYSPASFDPSAPTLMKPESIKPFTDSQMSDILALAQKTLRGHAALASHNNHRQSPIKHSKHNNNNNNHHHHHNNHNHDRHHRHDRREDDHHRDNNDLVDMDVESDSDDGGNHFGDGGGSVFSEGSYEPSESNRLVDAWEKIQAKAPEQFKDAFKMGHKKGGKGDKDKYIEKLHRQERVASEVKTYLKPYFQKRKITKDDYKSILKKAVNKICHNPKGIIQSAKIEKLVQDYVKRFNYLKKKGGPNGMAK